MKRTISLAAAALAALALTACTSDTEAAAPDAAPSTSILEAGQANPMIAQGVVIATGVAIYKSSGLGPAAANKAAPAGSPESFIDTTQFPDAKLSPGVTITEAQGMAALAAIKENLEAQGLTLDDVITMRVFLDNAPGTDRADYAGWNRAYRQYFANTNLDTGDTELVPLGTAAPAAPLVRNPARPSRFALEVASLPVPGWLVEIEVDAVYPAGE
ncbi:Rid family hydrolase [Nocardia sp. NPDC058176]|uniref:Rid family hydrolase n=1 Tax=Nocardia sp. NPDC058176 TaxID=3346368 RepID=UPI0036DA8AC4